MKRSLLVTVSVLALFSFIVIGTQPNQEPDRKGFFILEHGMDY
jgi:hypothetical protein